MDIVIPSDQLRPQTLRAVIEDFVTREGAVQGHIDFTLDAKVQAVLGSLRCGKAVIVFDDVEETFSIVPVADKNIRATEG